MGFDEYEVIEYKKVFEKELWLLWPGSFFCAGAYGGI
jgi:hypothetical protein